MRKIEFNQIEKSRANSIYLLLNFAGGDADTEHPQEHIFGFSYEDWENHIDEITKEYEFYSTLQKVISKYLRNPSNAYDDIEEEYGQDMAFAFDNAPNDPQCDYQFKCYLDSIELIGYDKKGNKFKSYL